ncbi:MAG: hypothetical protein DDT26_00319 [Dehalococcoidia bacterium]|nr:hypothetical protein [Chloroflexota bacterium]
MRTLFITLALVFMSVFFIGCSPPTGIDKEFDRTGETLRIKVITHDSLRDLHAAKREVSGKPAPEGMIGFAGWTKTTNYCEIHILQPRRDLDDNVMTLGHEMMHCLYGAFHK